MASTRGGVAVGAGPVLDGVFATVLAVVLVVVSVARVLAVVDVGATAVVAAAALPALAGRKSSSEAGALRLFCLGTK